MAQKVVRMKLKDAIALARKKNGIELKMHIRTVKNKTVMCPSPHIDIFLNVIKKHNGKRRCEIFKEYKKHCTKQGIRPVQEISFSSYIKKLINRKLIYKKTKKKGNHVFESYLFVK